MKEKGREEKKEKKKKKRRRRGLQERARYGILKFCMDFHGIVWIVACSQT